MQSSNRRGTSDSYGILYISSLGLRTIYIPLSSEMTKPFNILMMHTNCIVPTSKKGRNPLVCVTNQDAVLSPNLSARVVYLFLLRLAGISSFLASHILQSVGSSSAILRKA
jgi:hypothetical protein